MLVASVLGVACSTAAPDEPSLPVDALPSLVLQPDDLPETFIRFDEGRIALAEAPEGARSDPGRFGRQAGWKARYRQPSDVAATGPLVVASVVDLFESPNGASQELGAYRTEVEADESAGRRDVIATEPIGDETIATTLVQDAFPDDVRFYTLAWRFRNAVALVSVQGFEGELTLEDAVELARKQQARMEAPALPTGSPR